ncbi:polysaccharide biosynthesis/export family protein [Dyella telluris]|uniref:Polysaccharide biosynthesis/export family protein n=1 Tax=Dyella telluris TaxID=2763498 RepID=A0A7G8QAU9_9GAMM|nr:polysaccharide biosynthesis/export family protein [Dyella telluris]QNK03907.1 polysaccharide biosynthesis/export family protein [Dyella telluris]
MSSDGVVRGTPKDSSEIQLVDITPQLLDANRASLNAAVPQALLDYKPEPYRIGPGDQLYITVWDHPELTSPAGVQQQTQANGRLVRSDGTLFYPYLGSTKVAGLTIEELRQNITAKLAKYIEKPQVDINVVGFNSQKVVLQGAFMKTDPQSVTAVPLTLGQAIGIATVNADQANVSDLVLSRDGHDYHIDLSTFANLPNIPNDIYLKAGDRIFLPYNDTKEVYVMGEVMRPAPVPFRTVAYLSLTQAIGRAGGLNPNTSSGKEVYVIRGAKNLENTPPKVFQLDARSPTAFALGDEFMVKPGDVVFVGAAGITRWNRVISQLLPSATIVTSAAAANYSATH